MAKTQYLVCLLIVVMSATAMAYFDMDCTMRIGNCTSAETTLLYLYNQSDNFSNSHAQLVNHTATIYPSSLCCNSTAKPIGNMSNGTAFLGLWNVTNSHVENGSIGNYTYKAFISTATPHPNCYMNTSCGKGYNCLLSISSASNAHIANCADPYANKICCANREPHNWSELPDYLIYMSSPANLAQVIHIMDVSLYISNNYTGPTITASSDTLPYICSVASGNVLYVQNPTGTAGTATCIVNTTESGYPVSTANFTMEWRESTTTGGPGGGGGGGGGLPPAVTPAETAPTLTAMSLVGAPAQGKFDLVGFGKMVGIGLLLFLGVYAINGLIVWEETQKRKKRQKEEHGGG